MYRLLHIHTNPTFFWDTLKFVDEKFNNEIAFIGAYDENTIAKLNKLNLVYKTYENTEQKIKQLVEHTSQFDGIILYGLDEYQTKTLLQISSKVKIFLRFFGAELYMIRAKEFLSETTWKYQFKENATLLGKLKLFLGLFKRKIKITFNKECDVQIDNQKKVYQRFNSVMMINEFEYKELSKSFFLPKLITLQFTNHEKESIRLITSKKSNKIIIGNSGHRWNNHLDLLDIIKNSNNIGNIEFQLFFSYGAESVYSKKVKSLAQEIKNVHLIESFLEKDEFEATYTQAEALVINSYRQHAVGNIITAIKYGCKIYLNKRSSTYHWLVSKGFLINEVDNLKNDIESGNIKLSVEEQQHNLDCFVKAVKDYSVEDFVNNVVTILEEK